MPNLTTLCVDASIIATMFGSTARPLSIELFSQWQVAGTSIVAPVLLRYEVTNGLWQMWKHQAISALALEAALVALVDLPIEIMGSPFHHSAAITFARRFTLPATYDAHYLALAEELDCEFWTADKRLARAVQRELDWVRLFEP